jgi:hypothetical protein
MNDGDSRAESRGGEPGHLVGGCKITKQQWHNRRGLNYERALIYTLPRVKKYARSGLG